MSQQSFRELGASRPVVDALAAHSIHQPFRIQELVLPDALAGLDVLAKSPTGSGKTMGAQAKRAKKAHVLVATPGRLQDLADRRMVDLSGIRILILDEADRMLDMGFQPQVDKIVKRLPRNRQTMFFSATLDGRVGELASAYTNSPSRIEGELSSAQPAEIEHQFVSVTNDTKVETLVEHIRASESTLVFVRTKRGADRLVQKLARQGVTAVAMHGDMSQR